MAHQLGVVLAAVVAHLGEIGVLLREEDFRLKQVVTVHTYRLAGGGVDLEGIWEFM